MFYGGATILRIGSKCAKYAAHMFSSMFSSMELIDTSVPPPPMQVFSDGRCMMSSANTVKMLCAFQVSHFPFDTQTYVGP